MITNPRFQRYALDLAEELGIPVQESVRTGGSTNGAPIHLSNQGVPVIVIGIPVRYIHTHYGIAATATWRTPLGWPPPFWSGWTPRRSAASESQSCAPMGAQLFVDPIKTVPYALYTSAKIRCPSWLFAVDLSPFPHIQP